MFTKKNTIREIMEMKEMQKHLGILFPLTLCDLVPDAQWDESLEIVGKEVMMPWGAPFMAEEFLDSANRVIAMMTDNHYEFVPLWSETAVDSFMPETGNSKESVFLVTTRTAAESGKPAAIICPGGGYELVSMSIEGFDIAARMEQMGYRTFVLNYRVKPNYYPSPQKDLALALKYIKANAAKYGIDADNVMLVGSSAGGHLCASVALYAEEIEKLLMEELNKGYPKLAGKYEGISIKPDKVCLNYPVISFQEEAHEPSFQALTGGEEALRNKLSVEQHVDKEYPRTFIWACEDDELVPVSNTRRMGEALEKAGVCCAMKVYPSGGHGCGLAKGTSAEGWLDEMQEFFSSAENA